MPYIIIERHSGVVLKGKAITDATADGLVLKNARGRLEKLEIVHAANTEYIRTGSRLQYLDNSYYVEVITDNTVEQVLIKFNHSRFRIYVNSKSVTQTYIKAALEAFYKAKAVEKIPPQVEKIAIQINLTFHSVSILKMNKRWGSCTADNKLILNIDAMRLPFTLIDYLITHELCHTKVKDHSKKYWMQLS